MAAGSGHADTVETLLEDGADVNAKTEGQTPLMVAAMNGHTSTVKALLAHGADIEARDSFHQTAVVIAVKNCHTDTVKVLLSASTSVGSLQTALEKTSQSADLHYRSEMIVLLKKAEAVEHLQQ